MPILLSPSFCTVTEICSILCANNYSLLVISEVYIIVIIGKRQHRKHNFEAGRTAYNCTRFSYRASINLLVLIGVAESTSSFAHFQTITTDVVDFPSGSASKQYTWASSVRESMGIVDWKQLPPTPCKPPPYEKANKRRIFSTNLSAWDGEGHTNQFLQVGK